jgi:hypothetical protein
MKSYKIYILYLRATLRIEAPHAVCAMHFPPPGRDSFIEMYEMKHASFLSNVK